MTITEESGKVFDAAALFEKKGRLTLAIRDARKQAEIQKALEEEKASPLDRFNAKAEQAENDRRIEQSWKKIAEDQYITAVARSLWREEKVTPMSATKIKSFPITKWKGKKYLNVEKCRNPDNKVVFWQVSVTSHKYGKHDFSSKHKAIGMTFDIDERSSLMEVTVGELNDGVAASVTDDYYFVPHFTAHKAKSIAKIIMNKVRQVAMEQGQVEAKAKIKPSGQLLEFPSPI